MLQPVRYISGDQLDTFDKFIISTSRKDTPVERIPTSIMYTSSTLACKGILVYIIYLTCYTILQDTLTLSLNCLFYNQFNIFLTIE